MKSRLLITIALLLFSINTSAMDIVGIKLDDTITTSNNVNLVLNGAGIRQKFFIKIYIGALYLEKKTESASEILNKNQANRVLMHFIYDGVSKKSLIDGWNSGFNKNLDAITLAALKPSIDKFNALFTDIKEHDEILLDYIPGTGTRVVIKEKLVGTIDGEEFNKALLRIWLGKRPVTNSLKDSLLGKN